MDRARSSRSERRSPEMFLRVDVCHLGFSSRGSFFQGDTIFEAADLGFDLLEFLGLVSVQVSGAVVLSGVQDRALFHDQSGALLFQFVNLHL
jgi:hypothetical protein